MAIFWQEHDDNGYLWLTSNLGVVRAEVASIERLIAGDVSKIIARLYDDKDGMLERECTGAKYIFATACGASKKTGTRWAMCMRPAT